jgi:hypothetical protein
LAFTCLSINSQTPWYITGNSGTSPSLNFIGTTDNNPLIFKTRNIERMRLLTGGSFLGVGISNPQATLHLHYQVDGVPFPPLKLLQVTTDITVTGGFCITSAATKDILFKQQETAKFFIEGPQGGFMIAPNGKIGFGTEEPKEKVHVEGKLLIERTATTESSLQFRHPNIAPKGIEPPGPQEAPHYWDIFSDTQGLKFNKVSNTGILSQSMVITKNGNVGIGVATPQSRLDVGGAFKATSADIESTMDAGSVNITGALTAGSANITGALKAGNTNITGNTFITGNVGIGVTGTQEKLEVDGSFKAKSANITNLLTAKNATITNGLTAGNATIENTLITNNLSISGNLGLGTSIPEQKLHVKDGNIQITRTSNTNLEKSAIVFNYSGEPILLPAIKWGIEYVNSSTDGYGLNFWKSSYNNGPQQDGDDSKGWVYSSMMFFSTNNNIGIGTTNPQKKLDVAGSFKAESATITDMLTADRVGVNTMLCAKEIKVQRTSCWPDYVFSKNYKLLPLSEVEQFINQNQHLPNIPSAAEVEANGVNVGEMNALLLQKVEELMLYILDLQKQINELKKQ